MKKKRAIIVRDPRLRNIRNALRAILRLWASDIRIAIRKEDSFDTQEKLSELDSTVNLSICYCLHCGHGDNDMIYIPGMHQWLCIECNSKLEYYTKLRGEIQRTITMRGIRDFLERLMGDEGISLTRFGSRCRGYEVSKKILDKMGVDKGIQEDFLKLCYYYGGHCDCEIILNAKPRLLED